MLRFRSLLLLPLLIATGCKLNPPSTPSHSDDSGSVDPNYSESCEKPFEFSEEIKPHNVKGWHQAKFFLPNPKKKGPTFIDGHKFWDWYADWVLYPFNKHYPKNYGRQVAFLINEPELEHSQFTKNELHLDVMAFNADQISWETLQVGLDGIKGTAMDSSAISVDVISTHPLNKPIYVPSDFYNPVDVNGSQSNQPALPSKSILEDAADDSSNGNSSPRVQIHTAQKIHIKMDLKKFSFGATISADEIIRRVAQGNDLLLVRLKHTGGFLRVLGGHLDIAGTTPGDCGPPNDDDTTAPNVQIDSQEVTGLTSSRHQEIQFSADEVSAFNCQFDQGAWLNCGSETDNRSGSWASDNLSDGEHQLSIRAQDQAGNTSEIVTVQWTVDATPPVLTLDSIIPAEAITASTSMEIHFSANETVNTTCVVDNGSSMPCSSPLSLTNLLDGSHTVTITPMDLAQNIGDSLSYSWSILSQPPSAEITAAIPDNSPTSSKNIAFEIAGAEGTESLLCQLDSQDAAPCESPVTYLDLGEGSHHFEVRSVDVLGRIGEPASYTWVVDSIAPVPFLVSVSITNELTSSDAIEIGFGANETSTFICSLDSNPAFDCSTPVSFSGLAEGEHHFKLWATDVAGNKSDIALEYIWVIDQTAPVISIVNADPPGSIINSKTLQLTLNSNEAATFECQLDSEEFNSCTSLARFENLTDGDHTIHVRASDMALNTSENITYTFTVDTVAPTVVIDSTSPIEAITNQTSRTFNFSSSEPDVTFECSLDHGEFATCTSPKTYSSLGDGEHSLEIRARDLAGNVTGEPAANTWTVDTIAPETMIDSETPSDNPTESTSITFEFSSTEEQVTFECQNDSGMYTECSSPYVLNSLADGLHTFSVRAKDRAGNIDPSPATYSWTVDTTPLMIFNVRVNGITTTSATVTWSTNKPSTSQVRLVNLAVGNSAYTPVNTTLETIHSVPLTGLNPSTFYSVNAISVTATGQSAMSSSSTFKTSSPAQ